MSQQASAAVVGVRDTLETASNHSRYPVVPSQALVHKSIVRVEELQRAAVLMNETVEEHLSLTSHGVCKLLIEVRKPGIFRVHFIQVLEAEPLCSEPRAKRLGPGISKHPPHLSLQHVRIRQRGIPCQCHEFVVRGRTPKEE